MANEELERAMTGLIADQGEDDETIGQLDVITAKLDSLLVTASE